MEYTQLEIKRFRTAVTWLEYCRYGVKTQNNQSIRRFPLLVYHQEDRGHRFSPVPTQRDSNWFSETFHEQRDGFPDVGTLYMLRITFHLRVYLWRNILQYTTNNDILYACFWRYNTFLLFRELWRWTKWMFSIGTCPMTSLSRIKVKHFLISVVR